MGDKDTRRKEGMRVYGGGNEEAIKSRRDGVWGGGILGNVEVGVGVMLDLHKVEQVLELLPGFDKLSSWESGKGTGGVFRGVNKIEVSTDERGDTCGYGGEGVDELRVESEVAP
jgi:hypothetical protein